MKLRFTSWLNRDTPLFGGRMGLLATVVIALGSIAFGAIQESLAVLTNGLIAAVDIVNSLLFITALKHSLRSADKVHNYGYGKFESFGILVNAALLSIVLIYTLYVAIADFGSGAVVGNYTSLLLISLFGIIVSWKMMKLQRHYAKRFRMPVIAYDADVWKADTIMEVGIVLNLLIGLVLKLTEFGPAAKVVDSVTAIALILYSLKIPFSHSKEALDQLLDRSLPVQVQQDLVGILAEHMGKICKFKSFHTRRSGKDLFMEIDVVLPYDQPLEEAFIVERRIQDRITEMYDNAIVRMYVEPCDRSCLHAHTRDCPAYEITRDWRRNMA